MPYQYHTGTTNVCVEVTENKYPAEEGLEVAEMEIQSHPYRSVQAFPASVRLI